MPQDLEARVRVTADTKGVDAGLRGALGSVNKFRLGYVKAIAAIGIAVFGARKALQLFRDSLTRTQQALALQIQVSRTARSFDEYTAALDKAAAGTISNAAQIRSAGLAITLGVPAENLDRLLDIARKSTTVTGQTVEKAFNDISLGIARQSRLILDNLGIVVNIDQANRRYAAGLGITVTQLNELQRKQAFIALVLEQGEKSFDDLARAIDPLAESFGRLSASFVDVGNSFIDNIVGLSRSFGAAEAIDKTLSATGNTAAASAQLVRELNRELDKIAEGKAIRPTLLLGRAVKALGISLKSALIDTTIENYVQSLEGPLKEAFDEAVKQQISWGLSIEDAQLHIIAQDNALVQETLDLLHNAETLTANTGTIQQNVKNLLESRDARIESAARIKAETDELEKARRAEEDLAKAKEESAKATEKSDAADEEHKDTIQEKNVVSQAELNLLDQKAEKLQIITGFIFDQIDAINGRAAAEEAALRSGAQFSSNGRRIQLRGGGSRLVRSDRGPLN